MTWTTVAVCCAAFLGAFTGVAFLALFAPAPQPRHPAPQALPFDLDDADKRGTAGHSQHIRPDQGEL